MRGLGVALAAVKRSENAEDERDEVRQLKRPERSGLHLGVHMTPQDVASHL